MITDLSFRFVFIACSITFARAFASQLTGDHCTKPMDAGEIMMGQPAKSDETYRLQLHRLDMTEVLNGGTYFPSEEIVVKLVPKLFQAAFEVRGATFLNGKCGGHRVTGQSATIIFNVSPMFTGNVTVHSVWSKSYSSGVNVVVPFVLYPSVPALQELVAESCKSMTLLNGSQILRYNSNHDDVMPSTDYVLDDLRKSCT